MSESHALQFVGSPRRCQRWSGNFDERTSFGRGSATGQFRRNRCACVFRSRAKTRLEPLAPFPARALPETIPSQSFHYPSVDRAFLSGNFLRRDPRVTRRPPITPHVAGFKTMAKYFGDIGKAVKGARTRSIRDPVSRLQPRQTRVPRWLVPAQIPNQVAERPR